MDYSNMEVDELIRLAKENNDIEAKEFLFKKIQKFLWYLVKKWNNNWLDNDELFSMFYEWSYAIAYQKYDLTSEVKFTTYISRVIRNQMLHVYRDAKALKRSKYSTPTSLNELNCDTLGTTNVFSGITNVNVDFDSKVIVHDITDKLFEMVNDRQKFVFSEYYIKNKTPLEIANGSGLTVKNIEYAIGVIKNTLFYIINHMRLTKEICF